MRVESVFQHLRSAHWRFMIIFFRCKTKEGTHLDVGRGGRVVLGGVKVGNRGAHLGLQAAVEGADEHLAVGRVRRCVHAQQRAPRGPRLCT